MLVINIKSHPKEKVKAKYKKPASTTVVPLPLPRCRFRPTPREPVQPYKYNNPEAERVEQVPKALSKAEAEGVARTRDRLRRLAARR